MCFLVFVFWDFVENLPSLDDILAKFLEPCELTQHNDQYVTNEDGLKKKKAMMMTMVLMPIITNLIIELLEKCF